MRFLLVLAVVYGALLLLDGWEAERRRVETLQAIVRSPAFTPASVDDIIKIRDKRGFLYRVRFRYEVGGVRYTTETVTLNDARARVYAAKPADVAYDATNPANGMLKIYYDQSDKKETVGRAFFWRSIHILLLALPLSLVFWLAIRFPHHRKF
jgi:hypothetical protein